MDLPSDSGSYHPVIVKVGIQSSGFLSSSAESIFWGKWPRFCGPNAVFVIQTAVSEHWKIVC